MGTVLLAVSILFSNIVFFNLFDNFAAYGSIGVLFWADLFLLIALYVDLLLPAMRPSPGMREIGTT